MQISACEKISKKREKKRKDAPTGPARRNARGQWEVRRVARTLRGLQEFLQKSACGLCACEELCDESYARVYASVDLHLARRAGVRRIQTLRAFRRTPLDAWRIGY